MQGGKFGHGFFSAGVTKGLGGGFLPGGSDLSGSEVVYGTVVSAMIGGTASVVAGGKFANGARTASMQYLMNQAGRVNYRQIFRDVKRTWSEYWRDMFSNEVDLIASSLTVTADAGPTGSAFFLLGGVSATSGVAFDTGGNACMVTQACFQVGLGLYGGGGWALSITAPEALSSGTQDSWGGFYNVGGGVAHGGAVNFSDSTVNGAKGYAGGGAGANAGIQFCRTYTYSCKGN